MLRHYLLGFMLFAGEQIDIENKTILRLIEKQLNVQTSGNSENVNS